MVSEFDMVNNYEVHSGTQYSVGTWILNKYSLSCILHYILRSAVHQLPSRKYHQSTYVSTYNICLYSQTCLILPPQGSLYSGHIIQAVFIKRYSVVNF